MVGKIANQIRRRKVTTMKPLWEQVLAGDKVKVKAYDDVPAGTYEVAYTDSDLRRGADAVGIYTTAIGGIYLRNDSVEAIVERDGKPYAAVNWRDVRRGDIVEVARTLSKELTKEMSGLSIARAAGKYTVADIDTFDQPIHGLRFLVSQDGLAAGWIPEHKLLAILERDGKPYENEADRQLWQLVKDGDRVQVEDDPDISDGTYKVIQVDEGNDTARDGDLAAILVENRDGETIWIYNKAVTAIVERDGRPYTTADTRPVWEQVLAGDKVRIEGSSIVDDGTYEVGRTDHALTGGPDRIGVRLKGHGWVQNKTVKAIIERDGKPFGGTASTAVTVTEKKPYELAEVGGRVTVNGSTLVEDGDHEVVEVDRSRGHRQVRVVSALDGLKRWIRNDHIVAVEPKKEPYELAEIGDIVRVEESSWVANGEHKVVSTRGGNGSRLRVKDSKDGSRMWIQNNHIKAIVRKAGEPAPVPAVVEEPAWKRAKVGDWVKLEAGIDHPAGTFKVTETYGFDRRRIAIDYEGKNGAVWWIDNNRVVDIVPAPETATPVSAVRGEFLIHVDVPTILANKAQGRHDPVVAVRRLRKIDETLMARELAWDGPSRFVHHEFLKIEGTDIQNWIETDGPLTRWLDGQPLEVLTAEARPIAPMFNPILGAFVIHIAAPVLMRNRREGRNDPVIAVRSAFTDWANDVVFCRKVEWSGPTRMVHRPTTPIPGTEGRGVAFVETDAKLTLTVDGREPIVLEAPQPRLLAA
jgi:hypothetical protein